MTLRRHALFAVLLLAATASPVLARGGFMHGAHGFGARGSLGVHSGRMEDGQGAVSATTPVYVLIDVSTITDEKAFKAATDELSSTMTAFSGRMAADQDKPVSWNGSAASDRVIMIEFSTSDQAEAWKSSDAFKDFNANVQRSAVARIEVVQGLPVPGIRSISGGRRGRMRLDQKAFEPIVKEYDQTLNKIHGICKGC